MNCRPLYVGKNSIGDRFDDGRVFVFFSNKFFTEKEFKRIFPERKLVFNKQTHSDKIHFATESFVSQQQEGDSLISKTPNIALGVYSADCLPVLIHDPTSNSIASVHAGWRGVEQQIIIKTLEQLKLKKPELVRIWIGPHIKRDSFEVHADVADKLQASSKTDEQVVFKHLIDDNKRYVDLEKIAISQALSCGIDMKHVWRHSTNTFGDQNYYSFRRDGPTGRLISFICLIPE